MSEKIYRNYIYIDKEIRRVLAVKRTLDSDLSFHSKDFDVIQVLSHVPMFLSQPERYIYSAREGFLERGLVPEEKMARIHLLQRKIGMLHLVRTNVYLVEQSVYKIFQDDFSDKFQISLEYRALLEHFLKNEKVILLQKCSDFFRDFSEEVELCLDIKDLELLYHKLTNNCNIGTYSALKRGREDKDAFD